MVKEHHKIFISTRSKAGGGGHCIGDCIPTRDRGQSEVKRSKRNFETGQAVKLGIGDSLRTAGQSLSRRSTGVVNVR